MPQREQRSQEWSPGRWESGSWGEFEAPAMGESFFGGADVEAGFGTFPGVVGDAEGAAAFGGEVGGDGAVFQEVREDGGGGGGAEPGEAEHVVWGGVEAEAQRGGVGGEVIFDGGEDAGGVRVVGVGGDQQGGAGGGGEGDGAAAAVEGFGAGLFGQVADEEDSDRGVFGELDEGVDEAADVVVAVGVDGGGQHGHDGVDDDERGGAVGDGGAEGGEVIGEDGDMGPVEREDAGAVGAGGVETGADGIS